MATIILKMQYNHSESCIQQGCPSHEATLTYQSTSDGYIFEPLKDKKIYFKRGELEVFLKLLRQMNDTHCSSIDIRKYTK